jgi:hypothetical protein
VYGICRPEPDSGKDGNDARTIRSTSIERRIKQALNPKQPYLPEQQPTALLAFAGNPREDMPDGIPFILSDYLALVDWSGRIIREDKKGHIPIHLPDILQRLDIDPRN